ncbi:MAG TPA: transcriptional repressor [Kofleriaceae bacterium]|nr:transcriptional repressor [Kofleriaceae bacterium]
MRRKATSHSPSRPATRRGARSAGSRIDGDRELLRGAGLRSTAPRLAVLAHVRAAGRPVSHPEVADALEPRGFDRASLYRNLIDLTERGILSRHDFGGHVWRFDLRERGPASHGTDHPHFVCTDCGEVECMPGVEVRIPRRFGRRAVAVEVKGLCPDCG